MLGRCDYHPGLAQRVDAERPSAEPTTRARATSLEGWWPGDPRRGGGRCDTAGRVVRGDRGAGRLEEHLGQRCRHRGGADDRHGVNEGVCGRRAGEDVRSEPDGADRRLRRGHAGRRLQGGAAERRDALPGRAEPDRAAADDADRPGAGARAQPHLLRDRGRRDRPPDPQPDAQRDLHELARQARDDLRDHGRRLPDPDALRGAAPQQLGGDERGRAGRDQRLPGQRHPPGPCLRRREGVGRRPERDLQPRVLQLRPQRGQLRPDGLDRGHAGRHQPGRRVDPGPRHRRPAARRPAPANDRHHGDRHDDHRRAVRQVIKAIAVDAGNVSPVTQRTYTITASSAAQTVAANADTYVDSGVATTNFGTAATVYTRVSGPTRISYFRFTVPAGATPTAARLRLNQSSASSSTADDVKIATANTWSETTITYNTRLTATAWAGVKMPTALGWDEAAIPVAQL